MPRSGRLDFTVRAEPSGGGSAAEAISNVAGRLIRARLDRWRYARVMRLAWRSGRRVQVAGAASATTDDTANNELNQVLGDLREVEAEFWDRYHDLTGNYQFRFGPVYLSYRAWSQTIVRWFVTFSLTCFAGGVVAVSFDPTKELGIALIVGSIFAGGSFIVQVWAHQVQREQDILKLVYEEENRGELQAILQRRRELTGRIDVLRSGLAE